MAAAWKSASTCRQSLRVAGNIARAAFRLGTSQARTFKIIRAVLDVCAKLLLNLGAHL